MKRVLLIFATLLSTYSFAQTMRASLGAGSTLNRVKIFLKNDMTVANNTFSTLQFNIAIPQGTTPMPNVTVISSAFTGVTWTVAAPYVESGYINYNIFTGSAGFQLSVTAEVEFEAMEIGFSGGPNLPQVNAVHLVTLPDGGAGNNGNGLFYCTGSSNSNGQSLYYAKTSTVVSNGDSYSPLHRNPTFIQAPVGTQVSFVRYAPAVALPIRLAEFTAVRRNNDAILSWLIENQDQHSRNFEIERSVNGRDFTKIGSVDVNLNAGSTARYNFNDLNIALNSSSTIIYYRLKQFTTDGQFTYSVIRSIKLDGKLITINLYPNPAKNYTNVIYDLPQAEKVTISVVDMSGKLMQRLDIAGQKGTNQTQIDLQKLAAGSYMVKVQAGSFIQTNPLVKE